MTWVEKISDRKTFREYLKSRKGYKKLIKLLREYARIVQQNKCYWCKVQMTKPRCGAAQGVEYIPTTLTFDHRFEVDHYSRNHFDGVAACEECNRKRSNLRFQYWGA
jgi:hypothetical protein